MTHKKKVIFPDGFMLVTDEEERRSWKTASLLEFCVWNHIAFSFNGTKVKIKVVMNSMNFIYIAEYDPKIEKFHVRYWYEYDWDKNGEKDVLDEDFSLEEFLIELAKKL